MPITVEEKFESRPLATGTNASIDLIYVVKGTSDEVAALAALSSTAPLTYDVDGKTLKRRSRKLEPIAVDTFLGRALYSPAARLRRTPSDVGDTTYSFDTTGGTQHITQSLGNVANYAPAGFTAPDFKGAVGVAGDRVEGADVVVPIYAFKESHIFNDSAITDAYKNNVFLLTGRTNQAVFRNHPIGSVLFLGAAGTLRNEEEWDISFHFGVSPNLTNIVIGDITVAAKLGWEYLWSTYKEMPDALSKRNIVVPASAHVEKVHEPGDYSLLAI